MWNNIALARAQEAFLNQQVKMRRIMDKWTSVQAQVAHYYEKAFEASQASQALRQHDNSQFANSVGFLAKYHKAMAYDYWASHIQGEVNQSRQGFGRLITLFKITIGKWNEVNQFAQHVEAVNKNELKSRNDRAVQMRDEYTRINDQSQKEPESSPGEFANLKCLNVVKCSSLADDLSRNSVLEPQLK